MSSSQPNPALEAHAIGKRAGVVRHVDGDNESQDRCHLCLSESGWATAKGRTPWPASSSGRRWRSGSDFKWQISRSWKSTRSTAFPYRGTAELSRDRHSRAGTCREEPGARARTELQRLENITDITRLVVFDNWIGNCDRHPPDLSTHETELRERLSCRVGECRTLQALRHRPHSLPRLRPRPDAALVEIDKVRDDRWYGLFPEFRPFIDSAELDWCKAMLRSFAENDIRGIVDSVPAAWEVGLDAKSAIVELLMGRAAHLADKMEQGWGLDWRVRPVEK